MWARAACLWLAAASVPQVRASNANPMRKIVTILQGMSKETENEGDRAKELFDKFQCYCTTNEKDLTTSIEAARAHVGDAQATVKELSGSNAQLQQELKDLNEDVAEATKAVEESTAQRKRDAAAFSGESTEMTNSIGALDKAIPALKAGLETPSAVLAQLGSTMARAPAEQSSVLASFIQGKSAAPGSDQILGILEQMRDDFKSSLTEATQSEEDAISTFDELTGAKKKQIAAATEEINEKTGRLATQTQQVADAQEDLEDTSSGLKSDEEFLINLKKTCATKTKEHEANEKARGDELVAISEAIKILNSDDALESFKKTLPSPDAASSAAYFIQTSMHRSTAHKRVHAAARMLRSTAGSSRGALSFLATKMETSYHSPQVDLAPLKKSVTGMLENLKAEQVDDDAHQKSCKEELATAADEKASLESSMSNAESKLETLKNDIRVIKEEIEALSTEIKEIDDQVAVAEAQRKKEKSEFSALMSELAISSDLLNKAKTVLEKMYAPKQEELLQMRPNLPWENSLESFLSLSTDAAPGAAPETASYSNKGAAGMGVVGMLSTLAADIKAQQTAATKEEKESQADFDQMMSDSSNSRGTKKKDIIGKEAEVSRISETTMDTQGEYSQNMEEHAAVVEKVAALHSSCDFLLQNYGERKKARAAEIESVNSAFSILSGADFGGSAFIQEPKPQGFLQAADVRPISAHFDNFDV